MGYSPLTIVRKFFTAPVSPLGPRPAFTTQVTPARYFCPGAA